MEIYNVDAKTRVELIKQLADEVGWSKFELLGMVRKWATGRSGRMKHPTMIHTMSLDDLLKQIAEMEPAFDHSDIYQLFWHLVSQAPHRIKVENKDDEEWAVMIYCDSKILCTHDQSIAGAHWSVPDDFAGAYAIAGDDFDLIKKLEADGYIVDDSEYCPPDKDDPVCARCGAYINPEGYCADHVCPFSSHKQDDPIGWAGHPEPPAEVVEALKKLEAEGKIG